MPSAAPLELLHPPLDRASGGNVYDRGLLDAAASRGYPLASVVVGFDDVDEQLRERSSAFRIWDALLLERVAERRSLERAERAVLLHWMPSLDPAIDAAQRRRRESIERAIVDCATLVVVPGQALRTALQRRHPLQRIVCCEPAVREPFRAPKCEKQPHPSVELLTVCNLLPAKRLVELLHVLASLRAFDWRWRLVGEVDVDATYARRFDQTLHDLGLAQRVFVHGPLDAAGVVERMDRADLFVFPSRFESYGIVLAEAAARALPVIASRTGDAGRLFHDGADSLLVPPGDDAALRKALWRMITDPAARARFRARLARREVARGWEQAFAEFAQAVGASALAASLPVGS